MWQTILGPKLNAGFVLGSFCLGAGICLAYNVIRDKYRSISVNNMPDNKITDKRYTTFSTPISHHDYYTPTPDGRYLEKYEWDPEKYLGIKDKGNDISSGNESNQFKR